MSLVLILIRVKFKIELMNDFFNQWIIIGEMMNPSTLVRGGGR